MHRACRWHACRTEVRFNVDLEEDLEEFTAYFPVELAEVLWWKVEG